MNGDIHTWIDLIAALVTALATVALAWFTIVLARQTRRLADVGEQPVIVVTIESNRHAFFFLDMHVENTGTATAYDIEVSFDPPLNVSRQLDQPPHIPLQKISVLKPDQSISTSLGTRQEIQTKTFTAHTSWRRNPKKEARESLSYEINLNHLEGITRLGSDPEIELADAAKTIARSIERIGTGWSKLAVNSYDAADRAKEQQDIEKMHEAQTRKAE